MAITTLDPHEARRPIVLNAKRDRCELHRFSRAIPAEAVFQAVPRSGTPAAMENAMKRTLIAYLVAAFTFAGLSSCTTTYDSYGRPVQTVDPGAAAAGAAAAGVAGYAIGRNSDNDKKYYRGGNYRRSYGGYQRRGHRRW